jgi:KDO2-lipid IV(A) lauroyltransferase
MADKHATALLRLGWRLEAMGFDLASGLVRLLPLDWASAMGGAVVRTLGPLFPEHRTADLNLRLAFPELDAAARRAIIMQHWDNLGRTAAEFALVHRIVQDPSRVEVVGGERLAEMAREKRPAVLISGHIANWEVSLAAIMRAGLTCWVSYRPANNPYTDRRIVEGRERLGLRFAPKGAEGSRELLAALNRGESLALLNDQRDNDGTEAPFFGHLVRTAPGPTRFALKPGVELIPLQIVRLGGARFRIVLHEPMRLERSGDKSADLKAGVAQVNAFIEQMVRENPGQWLWSHRRFPMEAYEEALGERPG